MSDDTWTCEAGVDVDASGPGLLVILCREPATLYGWAALCDEHKHLAFPKGSYEPRKS